MPLPLRRLRAGMQQNGAETPVSAAQAPSSSPPEGQEKNQANRRMNGLKGFLASGPTIDQAIADGHFPALPVGETKEIKQKEKRSRKDQAAAIVKVRKDQRVQAAADARARKVQAAAIAAKEARRIAEMAYQGSRRTQENDENVAEDNGESYHMDTPHLSPARPKNSINGGYSTKALGGGRIVYEDEEDSLSKARVSLPQINRNI